MLNALLLRIFDNKNINPGVRFEPFQFLQGLLIQIDTYLLHKTF